MNAIGLYRVGHWCYKKKIPVIPKVCNGLIFLIFNSYVPMTCEIGKGTRFGYGCIGTVLHHKCVIGEDCIIGHNVTIGSRAKNTGSAVIGNSVYIAAGAKLLGNIHVGDGAVIGANAVVTHDVPERSIVMGVPARVYKENIDVREISTHIHISPELEEIIEKNKN